jgi:hypothetical protein
MSDIFISYAREDHDRVEILAKVLTAQGWSVWWDREIPYGRPFDQVIEEELIRASCVIVAWSSRSVTRNWVLEEAAYARDKNILVPILFEKLALPFGFRRFQAADLSDWSGQQEHPEYQRLVSHITGSFVAPSAENSQTKQPAEVADAKDKRLTFIRSALNEGNDQSQRHNVQPDVEIYQAKHIKSNRPAQKNRKIYIRLLLILICITLITSIYAIANRTNRADVKPSPTEAEITQTDNQTDKTKTQIAGQVQDKISDVKGKILDIEAKVLDIEGSVTNLEGRISPD